MSPLLKHFLQILIICKKMNKYIKINEKSHTSLEQLSSLSRFVEVHNAH